MRRASFHIGCASVFGLVAFVVMLIGSCFASGADGQQLGLNERLVAASCFALCVSLAAFICMLRDDMRFKAAHDSVRRKLLDRADVADEEFLAHLPGFDPDLLLRLRRGLATFFDVAVAKIRPDDDLRETLRFDRFEPALWSHLLSFVLEGREVAPQMIRFGSSQLTTMAKLAAEAQRVLDECCPGDSAEDEETPEASAPA